MVLPAAISFLTNFDDTLYNVQIRASYYLSFTSLVLLAYVGAAVLGMIPLTPGGLGFVEAGLTALLALAGVPGPEAVLATLAYRLVAYWLPLLVGPIAYVFYRRRYMPRRS